MADLLNFLNGFNLQTILSIIGIVWYFSRDVKRSIQELDRDVRVMNMRTSRLEGTVYGKDLYKQKGE